MEKRRPSIDDVKSMYERAKEAREFLDEFEEWLKRASPLPGVGDRPLGGRFRTVPQRDAVLEILEENPDEVYLTREIVEVLLEGGMEFQTPTPVTSISSTLSKAADEGKVERRGRGLWSAKDLTPGPEQVSDDDLPF